MGGAQVLLQIRVLIPLWGSDCTQLTLPLEWAQPIGTRGPILAPCTIGNTGVTGGEGPLSLKGFSLSACWANTDVEDAPSELVSPLHFTSPCLWRPFGSVGLRTPSLPWQVWDNSLKRCLWERNTLGDFVPKRHSIPRRDRSFGTNSELPVWGSWPFLWGGFSVGWVGGMVFCCFSPTWEGLQGRSADSASPSVGLAPESCARGFWGKNSCLVFAQS